MSLSPIRSGEPIGLFERQETSLDDQRRTSGELHEAIGAAADKAPVKRRVKTQESIRL